MKENESCTYLILKLHKKLTQFNFQYAIFQQQLLAQFVILNSQLLHATSSAIFLAQALTNKTLQKLYNCVRWETDLSFQNGPNTEVHWVASMKMLASGSNKRLTCLQECPLSVLLVLCRFVDWTLAFIWKNDVTLLRAGF